MTDLYSVKDVKRGLEVIGASYRQLAHLVEQKVVKPTKSLAGRHLYSRLTLWQVYMQLKARQLAGWTPSPNAIRGFRLLPGMDEAKTLVVHKNGPFEVIIDVGEAKREFVTFMAAVQGESQQ